MADVVLLDRVVPGLTPGYCVHGGVTCVGCGLWAWLGSATAELVSSGRAAPLCLHCARELGPDVRLADHVEDH